MSDLVVRGQRLPGIGWRYDTPVESPADGRTRRLSVIVEDHGPRHIVMFDEQSDEQLMSVRLSQTEAAGIAALLAGARLAVVPASGSP